jgi:hypothetical protein
VTLNSHTLVVYKSDDQCEAVWLDRDGHALTQPFAVPNCHISQFYPLLDGGLAVETVVSLTYQTHLESEVHDGQTEWTSLPDFLANRNLREFFLLPTGRGYALREFKLPADNSIQTFAPAGNACARVTRPELDKGPLSIGRDGTLLVQDFTSAGGCKFSWWPQLWH